MEKISCSVGILTHNSEKYLRRALDSVKDFSDLIIADGGSTDATLDIAREYGCTIIDQYSKNNPGPASFHPIEDFSRERNQMLDVAKEDWYLWIDSDEYISKELHDEIREVCEKDNSEYFSYEIEMATQSPDGDYTYKRAMPLYQFRFFNLKTGGRFEHPIHERFVFDKDKYPVSRLKGLWNVPITKPDFKSHSRVVNYRLSKLIYSKPPKNFFNFAERAFVRPLRNTVSILLSWISGWIKYSPKKALPFFYFRNRLYSQWVIFRIVTTCYIKQLIRIKPKA